MRNSTENSPRQRKACCQKSEIDACLGSIHLSALRSFNVLLKLIHGPAYRKIYKRVYEGGRLWKRRVYRIPLLKEYEEAVGTPGPIGVSECLEASIRCLSMLLTLLGSVIFDLKRGRYAAKLATAAMPTQLPTVELDFVCATKLGDH